MDADRKGWINFSSLPSSKPSYSKEGPITDHGLNKDDHKDDTQAANIGYTVPGADDRPTSSPVTDINDEKINGAAGKQRLTQDTLQRACDVIMTVAADETRLVDGNTQPKMITSATKNCPEVLNNPTELSASSQLTSAKVNKSYRPQSTKGLFLTDKEIATGLLYQPKGPRNLVKWEYFDDDNNEDFKLDEGTGWDLNDMYATNATKFNYKTTLDDDLSEYTTVLVREDTEEDRLRWERACRLANEIQKRRCPTDHRERAAKPDNIQSNRDQYKQKRRGRYQNYSTKNF
ncbi:Ataxin-2-like protein [Holothuria leucospilota]|uniref:Ataxin-2-like protein n=2 Tax=Holothuria leucospilota TaxID=206669 RepID=A0A9Q1GZQ6_HOLLE|nr:Ataxin-2-like protein [Holothuria leucospilota]